MKKITMKQLDHYWYYYKWHAIAVIAVILALIYTLYSCSNVVRSDLVVTYVGSFPLKAEQIENFQNEYSKILIDANEDNKKVLKLEKLQLLSENSGQINDAQMQYATRMRLSAEIFAGQTKVYIFSSDMLDYFKKQEVMQPLNAIGINKSYIKLNDNFVENLGLVGEYYMAIRIQPRKINNNDKKQYENAFKLLKAVL